MTDLGRRPLLFLDVDGPLIPFGADPPEYPTFRAHGESETNPLLQRIDPEHGPRLTALGCELVWATTWLADANDSIAPRLGLPALAVVDWPEPSEIETRDARAGLHWKTRVLVEFAAGRPFIWVDDELTDTDRIWVAAHHPTPALLHRVDPRHGITAADYTALTAWSRQTSRSLPPFD
ncbi:HAD domain-containing protein [Actinoalloteichus hymeniacidonis]|uniref:Secreted protein n=1 Tax=Actinoalloteichus hymeniacidonis TaxID=340345 RepID=A0AAC9N0X2_9PSEU|nr:HAD domain-containing protein [Actinoalloteichus hymeniacidonis]AOS66044.1 hypothetical protein TL08_26375 [Actinoalloteichus hymeniacidonis]MBB5905853.1 hypothetical protein [Actinoalloteichus hymeniacidonis]